MICPMTTFDCLSCDDSTGCKLLTCKARCRWPDCNCYSPQGPQSCRAEPWANLGRDQHGQRRAMTEIPAPQGREPARGGSAHCLGKAPLERKE